MKVLIRLLARACQWSLIQQTVGAYSHRLLVTAAMMRTTTRATTTTTRAMTMMSITTQVITQAQAAGIIRVAILTVKMKEKAKTTS